MSFPRLESLAHAGENLLCRLRDGKLQLHPALTGALLAMTDATRARLNAVQRDGHEDTGDFSCVLRQLEALCHGAPLPDGADSGPLASVTTGEITRNLAEAAKGGAAISKSISAVAKAAHSGAAGVVQTQESAATVQHMAHQLHELLARFDCRKPAADPPRTMADVSSSGIVRASSVTELLPRRASTGSVSGIPLSS